jgi:hypothetical protein
MAIDLDRQRIVLFGGTRSSDSVAAADLLGDTWELPARDFLLASFTITPTVAVLGGRVQLTATLREAHHSEIVVRLRSAAQNGEPVNLGVPVTLSVPAGQLSHTVETTLPSDVMPGTYVITAVGVGATYVRALTVNWEPPGTLRIVAMLPNPEGDETQNEAVHLRNFGSTQVPLQDWVLTGGPNNLRWTLDAGDGVMAPGEIVVVTRRGRALPLPNDGSQILLVNPEGWVKDSKIYGPAASGQLIRFD